MRSYRAVVTAYAFLTGATAAEAAAVSMMAGTHLDVSTANDRALEEQNRKRLDLRQHTGTRRRTWMRD